MKHPYLARHQDPARDSPPIMLHPPAGAVHAEAQAPHDDRKEGIHLHAVPASAVEHDLLEEVLRVQREEAVGRVVQCDAVEGNPGDVALLERCEERKLVWGVSVSWEVDVRKILRQLLVGVSRHTSWDESFLYLSICVNLIVYPRRVLLKSVMPRSPVVVVDG